MLLLAFALAFVLAGCDSNRSNSDLYLERLAGALELDVEQQQGGPLVVFPAPSVLFIERPPQKINLLEYLQVNRCDLGPLVGARNSGLGRVQTRSQRWRYDSQLVAGLLACNEASSELQALATQRQAQLGVAAFNALFAGPEWHAFATPPLSAGAEVVDDSGVERALLALNAMVSNGQSQATATLEDHLSALRFSSALGIQRRAWAEQSATLELATRMILSALATNPACRTGKPTAQGKIRRNVFERFYVAGVQPELARQGQPDRGWVSAVSMLVASAVAASAADESLVAPALAVKNWHEQVLGVQSRSEYGRWKTAITAHSRAWQRQLGICGLMPGMYRNTAAALAVQ